MKLKAILFQFLDLGFGEFGDLRWRFEA